MSAGRTFSAKNLSVRVLARKDAALSAFAFVVPVKASKRAVDRHFIKRRARHIIKKHQLAIKEGYYCVFFFRSNLDQVPFLQFEAEMLSGLKQAGLLQ
jgi:ribonuclease P protein component